MKKEREKDGGRTLTLASIEIVHCTIRKYLYNEKYCNDSKSNTALVILSNNKYLW